MTPVFLSTAPMALHRLHGGAVPQLAEGAVHTELLAFGFAWTCPPVVMRCGRSGDWKCDKRHGQGVCLFADGTRFSGEWEEDAWLQSAADPARCKVVGLTDGLAGQHTSFTIQVQPLHRCWDGSRYRKRLVVGSMWV